MCSSDLLDLRRKLGPTWAPDRPVRIGTSKVVDVQCGFDYAPSTVLNAQMSLRYCVAVALMDGQALPRQFDDARLSDPATMKLAAQLELVPDPELDKLYPANFAGWVAARDGDKWLRTDILNPTGSPTSPIDFNGIVEKFRGIADGLPVDAIAESVRGFERTTARRYLDLLASGRQPA